MKENHEDISLETLEKLSALEEEIGNIASVEDGFDSRLEEIKNDVNRLYALQSSLEKEIEKWSGLLDKVNEALSSMNSLVEKVSKLEETISSLDLNEVKESSDRASSSIDKAIASLMEEKDKPLTSAEAKGKKKGKR